MKNCQICGKETNDHVHIYISLTSNDKPNKFREETTKTTDVCPQCAENLETFLQHWIRNQKTTAD